MFSGVYTPAVTAFDAEGRIDYKANERLVAHLVGGGVDGILFLGSIGEFFTLSRHEKREFIRFAAHAVGRRAAVLIGTGATAVDEVVDLTAHAKQVGADAAVVISPYYFQLDEANLYRYYAEVAQRTQAPILLYNFPERTGVSMSPELVRRLASDFRNIVGIKDTLDSISHTRAVIGAVKAARPDFAVLSGFDEYLIPNLMAGGDGLIGGLSNVAPRLLVDLREAFRQADAARMVELQRRVNVLMGLYGISQPFVGAIKAAVAMVVEGVSPACRAPAGRLDESQLAAIRDILERAGAGT